MIGLFSILHATGALAQIKVIDDQGRQVSLSAPAQRIVSLAPHLTEAMFHLQLGDRVVGTVKYSDFPEQAKAIPRVGDAFALSIEAIVSLNPDLVIAWGSGGSNGAVKKLISLGVPVYYSEPKKLTDIAASAAKIALLAGQNDKARDARESFDKQLASLSKSGRVGHNPRVFFQISAHDLYTINNNHLIGQALKFCGGVNVFGDSKIPVPLVSNESVLVAAPEIIILSKGVEEQIDWKQRWLKFRNIPAVSAGQLYEVNADLITRPGFRFLDGVAELCAVIAKNRVGDSKVKVKVKVGEGQ